MACESLVHPNLINADCSLRKGRLVHTYYGQAGFDLLKMARDGQRISPDQHEAADLAFFDGLMEKYPGQIDGVGHATDIYMNQLRHANKVPEYVLNHALPMGYETVYGLRNKVGLLSDSPTEYLLQAAKSSDPIQRFETHRMLLLAELSMHLHMRTKMAKPYRQLREVDDLLHNTLYNQNRIETDTVVINSAHDNDTNAYLGRLGMGRFDNYHLKQHIFQARYVDGIGDVLVHPRKKGDDVSIMKALHKASKGKGMDLDNLVTDSIGLMFVALGDKGDPSNKEQRSALAQQVLSILQQQYGDELQIQVDNEVTERSSSSVMNWERYQVTLPGKMLPVELQFYEEKGFVDGMFKVGDLSNPKEKNRAHAIYEVQRAQDVFDTFYPRQVYNGGHYDALYADGFFEKLEREKVQTTANALKSARNITYNFNDEGDLNFQLE